MLLGFIMDVQQLFKILKKGAECPLCLETVKKPNILSCLHSLCLECLDKLGNYARRQRKTTIKGPVCQASFQFPTQSKTLLIPPVSQFNKSRKTGINTIVSIVNPVTSRSFTPTSHFIAAWLHHGCSAAFHDP